MLLIEVAVGLLACACVLSGAFLMANGVRASQVATWIALSLGVFLVDIPLTLLGYPVVALAIPFRVTDWGTKARFTQYPERGFWVRSRLPVWARPWDNAFDGVRGDTRGWFANWCVQHGLSYPSFAAMWWWTAVRNPINYFARCVVGCDVAKCVITRLAGQDVVDAKGGRPGWQFLAATTKGGCSYYRFFVELPWWLDPTHMLMIDIGWKVKLSHNGTTEEADPEDRYKGAVHTISVWKSV